MLSASIAGVQGRIWLPCLLELLKMLFPSHRVTYKPTHCFWFCSHPQPLSSSLRRAPPRPLQHPQPLVGLLPLLESVIPDLPSGGSSFPSDSSGRPLSFTPRSPHSVACCTSSRHHTLNPPSILPLVSTHLSVPLHPLPSLKAP